VTGYKDRFIYVGSKATDASMLGTAAVGTDERTLIRFFTRCFGFGAETSANSGPCGFSRLRPAYASTAMSKNCARGMTETCAEIGAARGKQGPSDDVERIVFCSKATKPEQQTQTEYGPVGRIVRWNETPPQIFL
jgi:hypothetical protein